MNTCQCRQDCRIRGSASVAIRRRWKLNQLANIKTHSGLEQYYSLKAFFFVVVQEEGFQVRTALSLFTQFERLFNALCQLPSVDMSYLHPTVMNM